MKKSKLTDTLTLVGAAISVFLLYLSLPPMSYDPLVLLIVTACWTGFVSVVLAMELLPSIRNRLEVFIKFLIIKLMGKKRIGDIAERATFTKVGAWCGNVSILDKSITEERNLIPLSRFELWLAHNWIEAEKAYRWDIFREVCIEVLGEDPEAGWV